jgi:tRNA dimethylallyltransferase
MKKRLLSVIGPTAIGKTKLAIDLAKHYDTEIISADSRQFYKEMHIGTAVPSKEELQSAPHHFIQHKSIFEPYSVGDFESEALALLDELFLKKDTVVMVGGSGLYVDAVTKGLDEFPDIDPKIRIELNKEFSENGKTFLQDKLLKHDPTYHARVDLDNPHRLIRALEVCIGSGQPYSSFLKKENTSRPFKITSIGITADRELIYERINKRVDAMIAAGLIEEAQALRPHRKLNALQTVGYKELFDHFDGHCSLDEAIAEIKKNTRRFAKRQLTWFKKSSDVLWVSHDEKREDIFNELTKHLKN